MGPTFEDRISILVEEQSQICEILNKEGYNIRVPRAEWCMSSSSLVITNVDGSQKEIPNYTLEKILDGDEEVPIAERKLIDEWYKISLYRFGHEIPKLNKKMAVAERIGDQAAANEYKKIREAMIEEGKELTKNSNRKLNIMQLSYYYNERGKRLERLYEILCKKNEKVKLRFGCIRVYVNACSYNKAMRQKTYKSSKGFFDDLSNAYDFVSGLRGEANYSFSKGVAYTNELSYGEGKAKVEINGLPLALEAIIEKNWLRDDMRCAVQTAKLELGADEILHKANLFLPSYLLGEYMIGGGTPTLIGTNEDNSVRLAYIGSRLVFSGAPTKLKEEVPKVLEAVLK